MKRGFKLPESSHLVDSCGTCVHVDEDYDWDGAAEFSCFRDLPKSGYIAMGRSVKPNGICEFFEREKK